MVCSIRALRPVGCTRLTIPAPLQRICSRSHAMPVDRQAILQLSVLLLAVPCQYLFSVYYANSAKQQQSAIKDLLKQFRDTTKDISYKYFNWDSWKQWCEDLLAKISTHIGDTSTGTSSSSKPRIRDKDVKRAARASRKAALEEDKDDGESPAVDVLKYRNPDGYFAGSSVPRSPRSSKIEFRVGQVIRHRVWGYRGVIVGWDDDARAPEFWLRHNHPEDKSHWRREPNYAILVDTRDREGGQLTYVPQENIEVINQEKVHHPEIKDYFSHYDGTQYIPRQWLRSLYPHD